MAPSSSLFLMLTALCFTGAMSCCNNCLHGDFCVRVNRSQACFLPPQCKNPKNVAEDDFFFSGLDKPGNTSNELGSSIKYVRVNEILGLNQLGLSMARFDLAPGGIIPPHVHPRASEILVVLEGVLVTGFVTTDNRLITKVLEKGDVFVSPVDLIHFQVNIGIKNAVAIAALSCEWPGSVFIGNTTFESVPRIHVDVLTKPLGVEANFIDALECSYARNNRTPA